MDVFDLRNNLVRDYSAYIQSFINISDQRVQSAVEQSLADGSLWPAPLIQLNPAFEPGQSISGLVANGVLEAECANIFRAKVDEFDAGRMMRLHRHQEEAVRTAARGENYVLTTGTGSGKSLAYIVPIVNHVLSLGQDRERKVRAIVVYPMNALANSQFGELEKFLSFGYGKGREPVTFRTYTGPTDNATREEILNNPPDILLTNYVMLELILTRPQEDRLVRAAAGLKFLVLDELHTYRGRQGADVSLLVRRTREATHSPQLQCVGTSATLASGGTWEEQRAEVADVASRLFGSAVPPRNVIGETLRRTTPEHWPDDAEFVSALTERVGDPTRVSPCTFAGFVADPLASWIESAFGVRREEGSGRLIRSAPRSLEGEGGAAEELAALTLLPVARCADAVREMLLAAYRCELNPETGFPVFAFRLHQFISRGDLVYATIEPEEKRYITLFGQQFVPKERDRKLFPLVFCRECGQEYYAIYLQVAGDADGQGLHSRDYRDPFEGESGKPGYLYVSADNPWPADDRSALARLPEDVVEGEGEDARVPRRKMHLVPQRMVLGATGQEDPEGTPAWFVPAPFHFCLRCGVSYSANQRDDFSKLAALSSEGRSTATTILSLSAVRQLRGQVEVPENARKLLSFTDNRQDASLQAGHFNDFVEVALLRSALYRAAQAAGNDGLRHDVLALRVFQALNLDFPLYSCNPEARFAARSNIESAFRGVLAYRLYRDLRRGWRVTSPNLEQCGLLEIQYESLAEACEAQDLWQNGHEALVGASPETRQRVARTLLDWMRRELAIRVDYLEPSSHEILKQQSSQSLIAPWALDENEKLETSKVLVPRSRMKTDRRDDFVFLSAYSAFGRYLRRDSTFPDFHGKITREQSGDMILQLLDALRQAGLVQIVMEPGKAETVPGYQLPAAALKWVAGPGSTAFHDPLRVPDAPDNGGQTNQYFVGFYRSVAQSLVGLEAREHTAQVPAEARVVREQRFRKGTLPLLYCSPTMELGVDISSLNVVNMRNVPPTPANYAQRSGRAGRSGQPALVFTYCTSGSPHDQYFFLRPGAMVSGAVTPPRIDLANEDLVRAHIHAIWLAAAHLRLGESLKDVLDVGNGDGPPTLALQPSIAEDVNSPGPRFAARASAERVLATIQGELATAGWYHADWLDDVLQNVGSKFDSACERWRGMFRAARSQQEQQNAIVMDASRPAQDKDRARQLRREAEDQLRLLLEANNHGQSDFYSYRYFASEGFLPGYSFPRLPLSAFIPGRNSRQKEDYLNRPRFLAITEFGPHAIIYHEGSRYEINRVILPVAEQDEEDLFGRQAKLCPACGYLHPLVQGAAYDLCERCGNKLGDALRQLFRLQNVSTRRRERISCDEEERIRFGYDLHTGVRFADYGHGPACRSAELSDGSDVIASVQYGHAATLWRINQGWRRRAKDSPLGFVLDVERGYWASNPQAPADAAGDGTPTAARTRRVIPYVDDRRNCAIFHPFEGTEDSQRGAFFASLQAALKNAIQTLYQLEDNEIAAEPLPNRVQPEYLLLYEASEGGAGVLRQLIDDPSALPKMAREALCICHFDPDTGEDRGMESGAKACEAACYNCLRNYANQRDHEILDRHLLRDYLLRCAVGTVAAAPTAEPRIQHYEKLRAKCGSELERRWLAYLYDGGRPLPVCAQECVVECGALPDFIYRSGGDKVAIYIDGPVHDFPDRQERDRGQNIALEDLGFRVLRFHHEDDWEQIMAQYPSIFGRCV